MLFERLNTQTEHGETKTADQTSRRLSKNGERATQTSRIYKKRYLPTHVFISKYDMTGIRKGSLALAEQVMSISTKCIIEKCGRVNKWSLDRVLKAVQIQMGMEGEGHDGRGIQKLSGVGFQ